MCRARTRCTRGARTELVRGVRTRYLALRAAAAATHLHAAHPKDVLGEGAHHQCSSAVGLLGSLGAHEHDQRDVGSEVARDGRTRFDVCTQVQLPAHCASPILCRTEECLALIAPSFIEHARCSQSRQDGCFLVIRVTPQRRDEVDVRVRGEGKEGADTIGEKQHLAIVTPLQHCSYRAHTHALLLTWLAHPSRSTGACPIGGCLRVWLLWAEEQGGKYKEEDCSN
mmetsp:Transcript_775/g.1544  ORF Transcript_775/g.1544 Transcript_775/m.1544 type:complete len:226 (-) Transcript_775:63-740(-)